MDGNAVQETTAAGAGWLVTTTANRRPATSSTRVPSGWKCASLPYLVELDNWGASGKAGQPGLPYWTWGYDEICWFAHQPAEYRAGHQLHD